MSPAHELALYLVAQGVCSSFGEDVHVDREPATPADVVTLYDTGGVDVLPDIELHTTTIQVRVRSTDREAGYELQELIAAAFLKPRAVAENQPVAFDAEGHRYIAFAARGDIVSLGRDDNGRALFTANYELQRQPLETTT
jgi:hypothetical protein